MSVVSPEFILPLFIAAAIFFHYPTNRARQIFLAVCNALFLYFAISTAAAWILLATFVITGYLVARLLLKNRRSVLLGLYTGAMVASFLVLKKYVIVQPFIPASLWGISIETLGISYLLFRQIHFLVDVLQEQIPKFSFWNYLNYQFNLFGFLSGPIQRYQEFDETWSNLKPLLQTPHEIWRAYLRLFVGLIKIPLSTYMLQRYVNDRAFFTSPTPGTHAGRAAALVHFAWVFYGYPIYLYFNFSGYCDIVIAGAALLGISMPENFDRPYLSRNLIDFWTRFHRTLGFWIRDYLFTPLYKAMASRWTEWSSALVFPCYFIAFVLAGTWHGSTLNWVVYGALHGLGVSANKAWEMYLIHRGGRKGLKLYMASPAVRIASIIATWTFVSFTMLFFPASVSDTLKLIHAVAARMI